MNYLDGGEPVTEDSYEGDELSLAERLDELERRLDEARSSGGDGAGFVVCAFGVPLGMILSWSKNASILWCILHGCV